MKNKPHGGSRPGSGRPAKPVTKTIAFRVPADMVEEIKALVKSKIPQTMIPYTVVTTDGSMTIMALNKKQARAQAEHILRSEGTTEKIEKILIKRD